MRLVKKDSNTYWDIAEFGVRKILLVFYSSLINYPDTKGAEVLTGTVPRTSVGRGLPLGMDSR
jgi:hypothetical protein